jgi:uncharacterized Zn finger protein (UPF0148 family)
MALSRRWAVRKITVRYAGECRKCGTALPVGVEAIYERHVGIFCPSCAPTDPEAIREIRQEAADRKAARYEEWAEKRREKAEVLYQRDEHYRGDTAFNTQPGHIPERARVIARTEKAFEHASTANKFEAKAARLRGSVRVAGDAERERQAQREFIRARIKVGMVVETSFYGRGIVKKINKKTATIDGTGTNGTYTMKVDLSFIRPLPA